jgi:lycopene beta-cyclase
MTDAKSDHVDGSSYNLVIIGGGCAGLALARQLVRAAPGLRFLVLEARTAYTDDRSWCFWGRDHHTLAALVSMRWDRWMFSRHGGQDTVQQQSGWSYQYIRSIDYYQRALACLAASKNASIRMGVHVLEIQQASHGLHITTTAGAMCAQHAVDTRPQLIGSAPMMFQSFIGEELVGDQAACQTAGLMLDMATDTHGFRFVYRLPLGPDRVLIEATRFARAPVNLEVLAADQARARARYAPNGSVVRQEQAHLPMGYWPAQAAALGSQHSNPSGLVLAGQSAGALRASTGYGFWRIQAWARACADQIAKGQVPFSHPVEPWLRRQFDRLFLQTLAAEPAAAPALFMTMAQRLAPGRFIRFMGENAGWSDYVAMASAVPKAPILRTLLLSWRRQKGIGVTSLGLKP